MRHLYLLSDGKDVFEVRMMEKEEALKEHDKADEATDGNLQWYGPYQVNMTTFKLERPKE